MNGTVRKPRRRDGTMRIGSFWPYSRTLIPSAEIARRNPDVLDIENHIAFARALEAAGVDFALIADGYAPASAANSEIGFQDPSTNAVILAVPLLRATTYLGIVSTLHTTFIHPVVIARLGAHLDWVGGGRWGWNIVNGFREHEARLFGLEGELDRDGGYERSQESVDIVQALWRNAPEGLDHTGAFYTVKGKIRRPVPPETPLLVSAAASSRGRAFAAANCDYLFTSAATADAIRTLGADLERDASAAGRRDAPPILMLSDVLIRDTPGEARQLYADLMGSTDAQAQAAWTSHLAQMRNAARKPGELMAFTGTTDEVAEQIVELHRACGLTGLILRMPLWSAEEAARLAPVLAQLRNAGVWTPPCEREYSW